MDETGTRLSEALAGRYRIEGQAGQGGMATVFRATDLKHQRPVAIKVLRGDLSAVIGADRFLREIEMSARLQHPHIVPLYDSGDAAGILYYVMPFVDGETLRQRLTREGRIGFEEAVAITREVASALAYAHQHGVVHRDIKPENIMLSGGHAVVADFGIARALTAAREGPAQNMTGIGFAIGTPAYMSPEQATASDVDARSDQYSLACVFYEMVTGQTPFSGQTVQAVLKESLTGPRPRLSKVTRTIPAEADQPVARALDSDPGRRYDSVTTFAAALEHAAGGGAGALAERRRLRRLAIGLPLAVAAAALGWILFGPSGSGPVMKGAESIAVLPFSTAGPGVELMGEGMVDLLSTNLSAVGGIEVVDPRAVLARWKKEGGTAGTDLTLAMTVARAVKARAAVVGSIVATGAQVRLSADLVGGDGKTLARGQVDGPADSVLTLVDALSLALVRDIWRSNDEIPSLRVSGLTTSSLDAMHDYLQGEQFYRKAEWDSAAAAFGRAVDQDSTFAIANYRLAMALGWKGGFTLPRAKAASDAALRFASKLPPRERTLVAAYKLFSDGKLAAIDTMRRYVQNWPDDVEGWNLLAESQYHTRQLVGLAPDELRTPFDRVLALDSTLAPAAIHPLEITLASRDSTRFYHYLDIFSRYAAPDEARAYATAGAMFWKHEQPDSAGAASIAAHMGVALASYTASLTDPATTGDRSLAAYRMIADAIDRRQIPDAMRVQLVAGRGLALASIGRFTDAVALADSLSKTAGDQASGVLLMPILLGIAPPDFAPAFRKRLEETPIQSPFQAYFRVLMQLANGQGPAATRLIDSVVRDTAKYPPVLRGALVAAKGWTMIAAGDTARGLTLMRKGTEELGQNSFLSSPLRMEMASVLAATPATRAEGLKLLRYGFEGDLGYLPIAYYALGRTADRVGDRENALFGYGQFLRLWDHADSSAQPRVQEARDALARLAGEPKGQ